MQRALRILLLATILSLSSADCVHGESLLLITNVQISDITCDSAMVRWKTSRSTDSSTTKIIVQPVATYEYNADGAMEHQICLRNLVTNQWYSIQIDCWDPQRNEHILTDCELFKTSGLCEYRDVQPPGIKDVYGNHVKLINNAKAKNPSWEQLVHFLRNDTTDRKTYDYNTFRCGSFAEELHNNAEAQGIAAAYVLTDNETWRTSSNFHVLHAFNAFQTTDRGLIFVDCTGMPRNESDCAIVDNNNCDKIAFAELDKAYGLIPLESVEKILNGENVSEKDLIDMYRLSHSISPVSTTRTIDIVDKFAKYGADTPSDRYYFEDASIKHSYDIIADSEWDWVTIGWDVSLMNSPMPPLSSYDFYRRYRTIRTIYERELTDLWFKEKFGGAHHPNDIEILKNLVTVYGTYWGEPGNEVLYFENGDFFGYVKEDRVNFIEIYW